MLSLKTQHSVFYDDKTCVQQTRMTKQCLKVYRKNNEQKNNNMLTENEDFLTAFFIQSSSSKSKTLYYLLMHHKICISIINYEIISCARVWMEICEDKQSRKYKR